MATVVQAGKRNEVLTWTESVGGGGGSVSTNLDVTDYDYLTVWWQLQSTTTTADLTPYIVIWTADRATALGNSAGNALQFRSSGTISDGVNVNQTAQFDVHGMDKISVRALNNNVGAKNLMVTIYLAQRS